MWRRTGVAVGESTWVQDAEPDAGALAYPYCDPWRGDPEWFQVEVREARGVTDRGVWFVVGCETPMCLFHAVGLRPVRLDYLPGVCAYCGLAADTRDHLIPRGWSGDTARSGVFTVPACRECNSAIQDKWAPTIEQRRMIAHEHITRKYSEYVGRDVSPEELAEYGPNLRSMIEAAMAIGEIMDARLAWPPFESYDIQAIQRSGIDDPFEAGLLAPIEETV